MLRLAVPDMVSNTYFPVLAAADLGFFHDEGVDASVELRAPPSKSIAALREGELDFVADAAHGTLSAFPGWRGAKLLAAVRQHLPWLLIVRSELRATRGDLNVVKGLRIGAAPGPDIALKRLLVAAGIEPDRDGVQIVSMSEAADSHSVSFGVTAAQALAEGRLEGMWVNGLAAAAVLQRGVGTLLLDVWRGDGPSDARDYTFASLETTDQFLAEREGEAAAVIRALVSAQRALQEDPSRATEVGLRLPALRSRTDRRRRSSRRAVLRCRDLRRHGHHYEPVSPGHRPAPQRRVLRAGRGHTDAAPLAPQQRSFVRRTNNQGADDPPHSTKN
jgi:NitT/TauT family transport system substrate-binding protein